MNWLTQTLTTLTTLRHTLAQVARAAFSDPWTGEADFTDPQGRMAAQARNSMGLLSISNR